MYRAVCTILGLLLIPAAGAQVLIFESESGTALPGVCDYFHRPLTCESVHNDGELIPSVGSSIQLDGRQYILEWMGPGYYLESGLILQPEGETPRGLKGQRWLEVYPHEGRRHISRGWKDVDQNQALSVSDTLALDSAPALRVIDVRLQLRVRPAPEKP